jgi:hypothetical protein
MIIDVPFTQNPDEWHCIHAAMHGVIKHFTSEYYSLDYINAFMSSDQDVWVWPFQVVKALNELGVFARIYSRGINAESKNGLKEAQDYVASNGLHIKKALSLAELEAFLGKGCVPIVILGSKKRLGKYVVLTGFDSKNFYYHESGPQKVIPNRAITKEKFLELWTREPSKNAAIIVYGKKANGTYTRFNF